MFRFSRLFQKFYRKGILIFQTMFQNVNIFPKTCNSQLTKRHECVLMKNKLPLLREIFGRIQMSQNTWNMKSYMITHIKICTYFIHNLHLLFLVTLRSTLLFKQFLLFFKYSLQIKKQTSLLFACSLQGINLNQRHYLILLFNIFCVLNKLRKRT